MLIKKKTTHTFKKSQTAMFFKRTSEVSETKRRERNGSEGFGQIEESALTAAEL